MNNTKQGMVALGFSELCIELEKRGATPQEIVNFGLAVLGCYFNNVCKDASPAFFAEIARTMYQTTMDKLAEADSKAALMNSKTPSA